VFATALSVNLSGGGIGCCVLRTTTFAALAATTPAFSPLLSLTLMLSMAFTVLS
jgi:hypothetical protein